MAASTERMGNSTSTMHHLHPLMHHHSRHRAPLPPNNLKAPSPPQEIPSCKPLHSRPATPPSPPTRLLIGCAETSARKNAEAESPPIRGSFNDVIALAPQYWAATTKEGALFRRRFPLSAVHGIHLSKEEEGGRRPCSCPACEHGRMHCASTTHTHPSLHPSFSMSTSRASAVHGMARGFGNTRKRSMLHLPFSSCLVPAPTPIPYFCFLHIQPPLLFHCSNTGFFLSDRFERASERSFPYPSSSCFF